MIPYVDQALEREIDENFPGDRDFSVTFDEPDKSVSMSVSSLLHFYLYDIRECLERRDMSLHRRYGEGEEGRKVRREPAPVYYDLSYFVTVQGSNPIAEHAVLASVLSHFLRSSTLRIPISSGHYDAPMCVTRTDETSGVPLQLFWESLRTTIRPAFRLVITVPFDLNKPDWTYLVQSVNANLVPRPEEAELSVVGFVYDGDEFGGEKAKENRQGIPGVHIHPSGRSEYTVSDERGFFYLRGLAPGDYQLEFFKDGYCRREISVCVPVHINEKTLKDMTVYLYPQPDAIPPPVIEIENLSFEGDVMSGTVRMGRDMATHIKIEVPDNGGHTITDGNGKFALFNLSKRPPYLLVHLRGQKNSIKISSETGKSLKI